MDEARAVLARLALLEELRGLVQAAEAWVRVEGDERAKTALERCDEALTAPVT
jgi:hypothetical protein